MFKDGIKKIVFNATRGNESFYYSFYIVAIMGGANQIQKPIPQVSNLKSISTSFNIEKIDQFERKNEKVFDKFSV